MLNVKGNSTIFFIDLELETLQMLACQIKGVSLIMWPYPRDHWMVEDFHIRDGVAASLEPQIQELILLTTNKL